MLHHFSHSELACPTTDQVRLAAGFGEALERLRVELDAPIYLTSACRSPMHNAKVGGHPCSLHLTVNEHWGTGGTCAVDTFLLSPHWEHSYPWTKHPARADKMFPGKGYHGTGTKFSEFDLSKGSDVSGSLVGQLGVSVADEPGMAGLFANQAARKGGAANILPLRYDPGKSGTVTLDQAKS